MSCTKKMGILLITITLGVAAISRGKSTQIKSFLRRFLEEN